MTLAIRTRAAVVSNETTYKGHLFEFHEFADGKGVAILKSPTDEAMVTLTDAEYESRDGTVYYVKGLNPEGVETLWRVVRACARCSSPSVYATPAYDRPVPPS